MDSGDQPFSPPSREQTKPGVWPKVLLAFAFAGVVALMIHYSMICSDVMQGGLDHAEAPFTAKIRNSGRVVYVTPEAFEQLSRLEWTVIASLPLTVLLGLAVMSYYAWYEFWSIRFAAILRGLCPRCLMGSIHARGLKLNERCPVCAASFNREQGYLVGALYFGYLFGILLALPAFGVLLYYRTYDWRWWTLLTLVPAAVLGPFLIRLARAMWMHMDYLLNPWKD